MKLMKIKKKDKVIIDKLNNDIKEIKEKEIKLQNDLLVEKQKRDNLSLKINEFENELIAKNKHNSNLENILNSNEIMIYELNNNITKNEFTINCLENDISQLIKDLSMTKI